MNCHVACLGEGAADASVSQKSPLLQTRSNHQTRLLEKGTTACDAPLLLWLLLHSFPPALPLSPLHPSVLCWI